LSIAYRFLAISDHPLSRSLRRAYRAISRFTLPAPKVVFLPLLSVFLVLRGLWYFLLRVCVCEPLFKAYCRRHGRRVRTGVYLHWIQGRGDIVLGDDVLIDGKCSFTFAARYSERPTLEIGDRTGIGHNSSFTVARRIAIGRDCRIAGGVHMFDASGHPSDPLARQAGSPTPPEEVRPITIGDNVWIGRNSMVFPGVAIGEGSVVAAGSVVMSDVPPNTAVAGNPARRIASLARREA
jgi:acetyltransferase-like isoleucine patch superfamily enzyme